MAYNEALAARIRGHLSGESGIVEKRMFGGIAFLLNGNMCCGVHGNEVIVRVDPSPPRPRSASRTSGSST